MGVEMTGEAKERVERHLDEVEGVLRGRGRSREERRGVVDDLEAQIREMVEARGSGGVEVVEEVLGKLDVPETYGGEGGTRGGAGVGRGMQAGKMAVGLGVGSALVIGLFILRMGPREWEGTGWWLGIVLGGAGLIFGTVGLFEKGTRRGMAAAGLVISVAALGVVLLPVALAGVGGGPAGREVAWESFWSEVDARGMVSVELWNDGTLVGVEKSGEKVKTRVPESALDPAGFKALANRVSGGGAEFSYKQRARFLW